jgi:hypothetical protein
VFGTAIAPLPSKADHAVLSTFKFPTGTAQVTHRDGVVIVNPARAVVIAHMLRKHLLTVHMHRLSKAERVEKMAALNDYMTSERCALHLDRIDSDAEGLLDLLIAEKKFHDNPWRTAAATVVFSMWRCAKKAPFSG